MCAGVRLRVCVSDSDGGKAPPVSELNIPVMSSLIAEAENPAFERCDI